MTQRALVGRETHGLQIRATLFGLGFKSAETQEGSSGLYTVRCGAIIQVDGGEDAIQQAVDDVGDSGLNTWTRSRAELASRFTPGRPGQSHDHPRGKQTRPPSRVPYISHIEPPSIDARLRLTSRQSRSKRRIGGLLLKS